MNLRLLAALLAIVALLSLKCVDLPPSPVLPTWVTQGSIPLVDRTFTVADFRQKDPSLTVQADGGLVYSSTQSFDPAGIDTILIEPIPITRQQTLGPFAVDVPPIPPVVFTYENLTGVSPPLGSFSFPPAVLTVPERSIGPLSSFEYIEFESGTISLTIRNTLPFQLYFPDSLKIQNDDPAAAVVAAFRVQDTVRANGGIQTAAASLAGKTVLNAFRVLQTTATTPGGTGEIDAGEGLEFEIAITNAVVRAARSTIPPQSVPSQTRTFVLDDSVTIFSARFRQGSLRVEIQNGINVSTDVLVRFKEMKVKSSGAEVAVMHHFDGTGSSTTQVDMSDLEFTAQVDSTGTQATFEIELALTGNSSLTELRSTDQIQVSLSPGTPMMIERVDGRIPPTTLELATGASGLTLGEVADKFEGEVSFDSIEIAIQVQSSSGFPADYSAYFVGIDRRSIPAKTDSILIPPPQGALLRRLFPAAGPTSIVLDNTVGLNTFLAKFFPHLPDTFIIRGTMTLNPSDLYAAPEGRQVVYDTSKIYSSVDVTFPVRMGIMNATVRDTIPLRVREKFPRDLAKSTRTATLNFSIDNGIPLALEFRSALLGPGPGGPRDTLLVIPTNGTRTIQAGIVDAAGAVVAPVVSNFAIELTGPEAELFERGESILVRLDVASAGGGAVVKVRDTDAVRVRASGTLVYQVNKP